MIKHVKYLILGAGPAGLQMAYFLEKEGLDYLILERNDSVGTFFKQYPVHRQLISINKKHNFFSEEEFNWRHDWNSLLSDDPEMRFTKYTDDLFPNADLMVHYLEEYAERFKLKIDFKQTATLITKNEKGLFLINTAENKSYTAEVLIMGLGVVSSNKPKDIEGIELVTNYGDQITDLEFYKNKRVAVLGGGNSAFETANYLAGTAAFVHVLMKHPLKMAWDTHFVGHLRAVNNQIIDMYQLKSMHAVLNPRLLKISKTDHGTFVTNHEYDYPNSITPGTLKLSREYDVIINCTGFKWTSTSLFEQSIEPKVKHGDKFLELKYNWESVNVSNLFFIGGAMQSIDRVAASGFIHGFRYNIRSLFYLLRERYESKSFPSIKSDPYSWGEFLENLYERYSTSAGLYQMFGVLCDYLVFDEKQTTAKYYSEYPIKYLLQSIPPDLHLMTFTLELGFDKHHAKSSLEFMGPSDPNDTENAVFLHPVIRHYFKGEVQEFHFGDSLLGRWDMPHKNGGAVMSYHGEFISWLEKVTGKKIEGFKSNEMQISNYHTW